jgi:hypothetical protein
MTTLPLLESLSDDELIAETKRLVAAERVTTAALLRSLSTAQEQARRRIADRDDQSEASGSDDDPQSDAATGGTR